MAQHAGGEQQRSRSSARIDSTHTPISRSGNDKSQTIGAAIKTTSAMGQLKTKSMHQAMKRSSCFMAASDGSVVANESLRRTMSAATPG
jgi:hypothetical protein